MPPYLAISHVWSETLYPPSLRGSPQDADGMRMITTLVTSSPKSMLCSYCWIDTWCIDQDDTEDKLRQIPLMGEIYKGALLVLITVRHHFTFSQEDWNAAIAGCQAMIDVQRLPGDEYQASPARMDSLTVPAVRSFFRCYSMMLEVADLPWGSRIWTAQEYILAKSELWIGSDLRPLHVAPADCRTIYRIRWARAASLGIFKEALGIGSDLGDAVEISAEAFDTMNSVKLDPIYSTKAMLLASTRKCSVPVDEIYGFMAASGVVIEPVGNESPECAWCRWWAQSIRFGNLYYALLPKARDVQGLSSSNCVMPPYELRCQLGTKTLSHKADSWGTVTLRDGTIDAYGKVAGEIHVGKFLCEDSIPNDIEGVARICGETIDAATAFMLAIDISQTSRSQASAQAENVHAAFRCLPHNDSLSRAEEASGSLCTAERERVMEMSKDFQAPPWVFDVYGRVYLASLKNSLTVSDILVITNEVLDSNATLLALDLIKRFPNEERHITKQLMVARPSPDGKGPMHKVGMTYPVSLHEDSSVDIKSCICTGHVLEDKLEKFSIGGSLCWYCSQVGRQ
jgi:Heterokaryon incompatibility protein (HET)